MDIRGFPWHGCYITLHRSSLAKVHPYIPTGRRIYAVRDHNVFKLCRRYLSIRATWLRCTPCPSVLCIGLNNQQATQSQEDISVSYACRPRVHCHLYVARFEASLPFPYHSSPFKPSHILQDPSDGPPLHQELLLVLGEKASVESTSNRTIIIRNRIHYSPLILLTGSHTFPLNKGGERGTTYHSWSHT